MNFKVEVSESRNFCLKSCKAAAGRGAAEVRGQLVRGAVQQLHLGSHRRGPGGQEQGRARWEVFGGCSKIQFILDVFCSRPSKRALPWGAAVAAARRSLPQC